MGFTAADHVSQREPGPWRDCTFASMLECIRLVVPDGERIPATEAEKERFRAAAGLPDDHGGATIEDALPAAKRLYGLDTEHYVLTLEWEVLERALRDPGTLAVVQGKMSALPSYLRRWSPGFLGPHAVAARGNSLSPTWCDPLAPKGSYAGEPVTWPTWRAFFASLPGARALIMKRRTPSVISVDPTLAPPKVAVVLRRTPILNAPAGVRVADAQAGYRYPYIGLDSGYRAVVVKTKLVWNDGKERPTLLYVANNDVTIELAPPVGDVKQKVTLAINDQVEFSKEV